MPKVLYERDGRIARITLNRPEVLNAIDDDLPRELADAVARADADGEVHVIVLAARSAPDTIFCTMPRRKARRATPRRCRGTRCRTTP